MATAPQLGPFRNEHDSLLQGGRPYSVSARQAEPTNERYRSMARRRYQTGELFKRGTRKPVWIGRYREDAIQADGQTKRIYRSERLGLVSQLTEKQARRAFEPFLARVNSIDYQPERFAQIGE